MQILKTGFLRMSGHHEYICEMVHMNENGSFTDIVKTVQHISQTLVILAVKLEESERKSTYIQFP